MISKEELIKLFKECNFAHGDYEILIDKIVQAITAEDEIVENECECNHYIPDPVLGWICPECGRKAED